MKRPYHHGNLREALIRSGLKLIEEQGVRALTLREIGSRVGVSRTAAYRHFADKEDLLAAIREAGFGLFADSLESAKQAAPHDFASRLTAMALAYVRFAAHHSAYYEVMFGWRTSRGDHSKPSEQGARAFGILEQTIREGQQTGEVRPGDTVMLARLVWAQVHGISTLGLYPDLGPEGAGAKFVEFCSEILQGGLSSD
jgi:AcrR family transcriptional regulator